ncbi:transmembrane protein, putative (macronuclear) [Tetrahymena thermophila SB210]|uniref:Transmembrane protein, putative n=1 Tax=Tetrahymena thermophila (strain SB210) TaxID=312017 RepID=W7X4J2_TETTS|nr:transmembrane protein, putative [Tetrahymena thermophila SB210]EWS71298.1 transmembrane protein, putative [Tetrahymena thermophila SB210]|eukprot:XP_012656162.1 transmembrane protein, putative [Tetrahymena thermophila SB210]
MKKTQIIQLKHQTKLLKLICQHIQLVFNKMINLKDLLTLKTLMVKYKLILSILYLFLARFILALTKKEITFKVQVFLRFYLSLTSLFNPLLYKFAILIFVCQLKSA